jgi:PKD repeat protein
MVLFSSLFVINNNLNNDNTDSISSLIADFALYPNNPTVFEKIQFYDQSISSKSQISLWEWDFGDGNTSNYQNPEHAYEISGTYNIELKIKDKNGNTDKMSKPLYVKDKLVNTMKNQDEIVKNENNDLIVPIIIGSFFILLIFIISLLYIRKYH